MSEANGSVAVVAAAPPLLPDRLVAVAD